MPYNIIRRGNWKLIKRYEGRIFEVYDLKNDIGETTDLSDRRPDTVKVLDAKLTAWLGRVGARLPKPNLDHVADE